MTRTTLEQTTVGDIVANDFRTAAVFERHGIDFCCGGRRTIAEACHAARVDPVEVVQALEVVDSSTAGEGEASAMTEWPLDRLADHIVETHHAYVRSALPAIAPHLATLVRVHGERHPELTQVSVAFSRMSEGLVQHMMKEELVLFPYIRELANADHGRRPPCPFGTIEHPIRMMEREHQDAGRDLQMLRELTNGYEPPADGCATYRLTMAELDAFEREMHLHVHLENNVLFPRATERERELRRMAS